jgi:hypothetical protein
MSKQRDADVDAIVQQILDEADQPFSPTISTLKARAAKLPPAEQVTLMDRVMLKNPPLLATSSPTEPPPA